MCNESRIRPYAIRAATAVRHSPWNGTGFRSVIGMSISAALPPSTRLVSCGPMALAIATPRPL